MAYYLGKDVTVHWTTEASGLSLSGAIATATGDSLSAVKGASSSDTGILVLERADGIDSTTLLSDITGVAFEGNPLDKLNKIMPKIDPELVQTRLYGKQKY